MTKSPNTLDKTYDPRLVEPDIYANWEAAEAFRADPNADPVEHPPYTIVIPPPNVTGALHLGHALNNTLQDILIRYHRMRGFNTLWQPGTDHAGIATQAVVERRIRETEGKSRHELGREELVRRIWAWKDEYEKRIISQLKLMGCSCDWSRNRFTLDEGMSRAVREMFFRLFRDGLIFRGKRLVNWDTQLQTAVSDDEVYHETVKGHFYHIKYPILPTHLPPVQEGTKGGIGDDRHEGTEAQRHEGEPEYVVIATTRPETMLGDVAVAVHPDPEGYFRDEESRLRGDLDKAIGKERLEIESQLESLAARRASHLPLLIKLRDMARQGRKLRLPLTERIIPLICDEWANPLLGTGCVKITPAHDPNDYEVGLSHGLPMINVLTPDGKVARIAEPDGSVNAHCGAYEDLPFNTEARNKVVADLEAKGRVKSVEDRDIELGHSDRSKLPIEPFLSDQWFLSTKGTEARKHEGTNEDQSRDRKGAGLALGLAQSAMDVVTTGRIQVFPSRYAKTYLDWLGEKRDWCISRQLWWGHRIPVWLHDYVLPDRETEAVVDANVKRGRASVGPYDPSEMDMEGPYLVQPSCEPINAPQFGVCVLDPNGDDGEFVQFIESNFVMQDPDVLDTWFSSALWPFSTLGWPEETAALRRFYPGSVLCTSRDIITNWVARMVMFGLYAMGEVPFRHVYIHPKILDGRGETMSKSKGNGVDPVDIIHTHGADALRYSMADLTTETQDIRMPVEYLCPHCGHLTDQGLAIKAEEQSRKSRGQKLERKLQPADCTRVKCSNKDCGREFATQWADATTKEQLGLGRESSDKFEIGRNFCNKLWNAARYAFQNLEGAPCESLPLSQLPPEDRWILARLSQTIRLYHECIGTYQFSASVKELRDFLWDSLCDWYLELTKPRLSGEPQTSVCATPADSRHTAQQVLAFCLDQVLRLWHPTIPFITERLWTQLNQIAPRRGLPGIADLKTDGLLIRAKFPPLNGYPALDDDRILATFAELQDATRGVRDLRSQCNVPPRDKVSATVAVPPDHVGSFRNNAHIVRHLANVGELCVSADARRPKNAGSVTIGRLRIYVHDISDDDAERARATKALADLNRQIAGKESKLGNAQFVQNAKPEVVEAERGRLAELTAQRDHLQSHLVELGA